jgi:hypothetical protein
MLRVDFPSQLVEVLGEDGRGRRLWAPDLFDVTRRTILGGLARHTFEHGTCVLRSWHGTWTL